MSKILTLLILGGVVLAAVGWINIGSVSAREETKFVQVSVLAEDQANYSVDENSATIPAVSAAIIEDKVHDLQMSANIPTIRYTTLPPQKPVRTGTHSEGQTVDPSAAHNNHENNGNSGANPNAGAGVNNGNGTVNGHPGGNQNHNQSSNHGNGSSNQSKETKKSDATAQQLPADKSSNASNQK